jgi:DnaK suppressor protein
MNDRQKDYFRAKLLAWKDEILRESKLTLQALQEENVNHPDLADRASSETDRAIELRARDRQRKLTQDRRGAAAHRGQFLWVLRGDRRADFAEAPRGPPDRDAVGGSQERHEKREKVYRDE